MGVVVFTLTFSVEMENEGFLSGDSRLELSIGGDKLRKHLNVTARNNVMTSERGAVFDFPYFRENYMALAREHMGSHGLVRIDVERGLGGFKKDEIPAYVCIASLYNEIERQCRAATAAAGRMPEGHFLQSCRACERIADSRV